MQSVVEVVCVGNGSNKTYNSVYTDPGFCKMVIVQDDDKFPSPRLCLLRRWPNFEGGFGFNLYEDLISSTGALKVEEVVRNSPAEAGGLRKNDVIIEINGDNIEFKSFFRLLEILKEACNQSEMELLVLAERDAEWYRVRNICVNSNFPNIEYCETPYYGHVLKPIDVAGLASSSLPRNAHSQIEFHSSTGKLYRTTLVIDNEKDSVYRRIEELPPAGQQSQSADQQIPSSANVIPPLRPDGTFRHPGSDNGSVRVYYRRDRNYKSGTGTVNSTHSAGVVPTDEHQQHQTIADSGHGSLSNRLRSTPLSTTATNLNNTSMSPYSTLGKSYGENAAVDLLHDKWADLMDQYLDSNYNKQQQPDRDTSSKRNNVIRLYDPNATVSKRSRCTSPQDASSFSYLYSGRDDYQTASATSFRDINRQTSPYQHLIHQRGSPQTQSQRYPSPHQSVTSPTRSNATNANLQQQQRQPSQPRPSDVGNTVSTSSFQHYESSSYTSTNNLSGSQSHHHHHHHHIPATGATTIASRESSPSQTVINAATSSGAAVSNRSNSRNPQTQPSELYYRPKSIYNTLGFELDENEARRGQYYVKSVDPNSASALAGLKPGDKITKINSKPTAGMAYDDLCNEIKIAHQHQQQNNIIHLMVMRRSAKSTGSSSYLATTTATSSSISNFSTSGGGIVGSGSGPTVLPIKNNLYTSTHTNATITKPASSILTTSTSSNLYNDKTTSSFVDEGYVPGSVTSATSISTSSAHHGSAAATGSSTIANLIPGNLVSVVRVTSPTNQSTSSEVHQVLLNKAGSQRPSVSLTEVPAYQSYESAAYQPKPNVIYDSQETKIITEKQQQQLLQQQQQLERERELAREQEQREREQRERERELYEKELRAREQLAREREQYEKEQRERELYEREQREREQRERELREREQFEREQREREQREREQREREQREREQREREQREREQREREQREREQREREQREREQHEREQREREQREREQRERERYEREQREREQRERERYEREQRELEFAREQEQKEKEKSNAQAQAALAALTTIVVTGSEPQKAQLLDRVKPYPIEETQYITTTESTVISQMKQLHEQIIEQHDPTTGELNHEVIETDFQSTYIPDHEQIPSRLQQEDGDNISQSSELDRQRREFAEQEFNRQQEVMKHLIVAMNNPELSDKLRTYSLYKSQHFFGYGIAFHTESIQPSEPYHKLVYPLIEIESNSPAEDAGMRNGQRVVAVNGDFVNIEFGTLEDVVQGIEDSYYSRNFTDITVLDPLLWSEFMENPELAAKLANQPLSRPVVQPRPVSPALQASPPSRKPSEPNLEQLPQQVQETFQVDRTVPRLCRLSRPYREAAYGFDFKTLKNEGRHVANNVCANFPAEKAGLRDGDYILEVNGESIDGIEHDVVVNKISANPKQVDLFVVSDLNAYLAKLRPPRDQSTDQELIELSIPSFAPSKDISYHKVNLIPGFKGLGISLLPNGIINSVDPNSPSEKAGLRKDYKIVQVNGIDVRDKSNKEIGQLIKENENNLVIGVHKAGRDDLPISQRPTPTPSAVQQLLQDVIITAPKSPQLTSPTYDTTIPSATQSISSASGKNLKDQINGTRVCNLISRPDYQGFGFTMRGNDKGPHQISNVEKDSPAQLAGLRSEDLILKVNDVDIVGERYQKTVTLIKNELDKGRLKLEVIEPQLCPPEIRNKSLVPQSAQSTVASRKPNGKRDDIANLRDITAEALATGSSQQSPDRIRAVSADPANDRNRQPRPLSMSAIEREPQNQTVRSNNSFGSTATGLSDPRQSNLVSASARSVGNLSTMANKPKFKRCNVQLLPEFRGYGFTLNSKSKPKYSIFSVDPVSPAYAANLRATDVIVEIDKKNIRRLKFEKVKQMLKDSQSKGQVEILAISKEGYTYFKEKRKRFSQKDLARPDNTEPYSTLTGRVDMGSSTNLSKPFSSISEGEQRITVGGVGSSSTNLNININNNNTIKSSPSPSSTLNRQVTSQVQSIVTGTDLDNFDIIPCTVNRGSVNQSIGLSLSTAVSSKQRSLSRSMSSVRGNEDELTLPIITSVEPGSIAEQSGLRAGDLVLEINGKATSGQSNATIASWIKSTGNTIEFLVSREKQKQQQQQQIINRPIIESAKIQASPTLSTGHLSRKESAALTSGKRDDIENLRNITAEALGTSSSSTNLRNITAEALGTSSSSTNLRNITAEALATGGSPRIVHEEIKMSSSRIQQESNNVVTSALATLIQQQHQQPSPLPSPSLSSAQQTRERNQSEPAPSPSNIAHQINLLNTSNASSSSIGINNNTSPNISRRSASQYTLPRDAPIPRLCKVRAYEEQLGFTVAGSKASRGIFKVNDVTPNSPAAHGGLLNDDFIIEISGVNVENMTYNEVVNFIKAKKQEDDLQLLVADRATLQWYKNKKVPISSQIVPKMQYIETLLKDELQPETVVASVLAGNESSESKLHQKNLDSSFSNSERVLRSP